MRFKTLLFSVVLLLASFVFAPAQDKKFDGEVAKDDKKNQKKPAPKPVPKIDLKKGLTNGVQVGEFAILIYSHGRGRPGLNQIRKTTVEIGKVKTTNPDGKTVASEYEKRIIRSENLEKEKIRLNQKFPDAEYALIYDGKKIFGLYDNSVFTPREDAVKTFENQIWHGAEALLRYRENGAEIKLEKEEKIMGVTLYVVTVTDKEKRKTTFYVSKKSLRIMMLKFEEDGVKYQRKFYDHNLAQGTLVPYRSVLWADGKIIEEKDISTITFGQPLDEAIFQGIVAQTP